MEIKFLLKFIKIFLFSIFHKINKISNQTILSANGKLNTTYDLINEILGDGNISVETPDCAHKNFGKHITQIKDSEKGKNKIKLH